MKLIFVLSVLLILPACVPHEADATKPAPNHLTTGIVKTECLGEAKIYFYAENGSSAVIARDDFSEECVR